MRTIRVEPAQQVGKRYMVPASRRSAWRRRFVFLFTTLVGAILLFAVALNVFLSMLPGVSDAGDRTANIVTLQGGTLIQSPPPAKISQAIVSIEDRRFYSHPGVDFIGLVRAGWGILTSGDPGGGATIAQQLAKNLYVPDDGRPITKLRQVGIGLKLESAYSKEQVLTMYLNAIYYGEGQWGIAQASMHYFGKQPDELDWAEASLIAGLPQAPSAYAPSTHLDLAKQRQQEVLASLVRANVLTQDEADAAYAEPLNFANP